MPSRIRAYEPVLRRSFLLVVVYATAAVIALLLARRMTDPDIGWHLRVGEWTVAHRAVPDEEIFSSHSVPGPWVAYSWAYDVLLYGLRTVFGLHAQLVLAVTLSLLIAHTLFDLVRRISGRTPLAAAMTGVGIIAMAPMLYGRSTMFTILFALLEIHLLVRASVLGQRQALLLVPLVFVAWANVHVQFLFGFFVYACFLAQAGYDARAKSPDPRPLAERRQLVAWMSAVGAASLAATLVNPYGIRIYDPLLRYLGQAPTIYQSLRELQPPSFSLISTWMALGIALVVLVWAARRMLGRPFLLALFAVAAFVGFRSERDEWFIVATGATIVAIAAGRPREPEASPAHPLAVGLGTASVVALAAWSLDLSTASLTANLRRHFPVGAAEFIEAERLPGPMYNHYNWGGYLMWRLPDWKVSIDGRSYVHATEYFEHTLQVWKAAPGWEDDPDLSQAGFVVGQRGMPLTAVLADDPRFRLAYEDEVSAVYVRR